MEITDPLRPDQLIGGIKVQVVKAGEIGSPKITSSANFEPISITAWPFDFLPSDHAIRNSAPISATGSRATENVPKSAYPSWLRPTGLNNDLCIGQYREQGRRPPKPPERSSRRVRSAVR